MQTYVNEGTYENAKLHLYKLLQNLETVQPQWTGIKAWKALHTEMCVHVSQNKLLSETSQSQTKIHQVIHSTSNLFKNIAWPVFTVPWGEVTIKGTWKRSVGNGMFCRSQCWLHKCSYHVNICQVVHLRAVHFRINITLRWQADLEKQLQTGNSWKV